MRKKWRIGAIMLVVSIVFVGGLATMLTLLQPQYEPYTDVVYCDGGEIAKVTADTNLSAAHPRVDGDWVVWFEGSVRHQVRISQCQSIVILQVPVGM